MKTARVIPCLDVDAGRVVKGTNFVDLRDASGVVQVVVRDEVLAASGAHELRNEYCIAVTGVVEARPADTLNAALATGEIEVAIVFSLATIGPAIVGSMAVGDVYVTATFMMVLAATLIVGNIIADMLLALLDPRVRLGGAMA